MKKFTSKLDNSAIIKAQQYFAQNATVPDGVKARMSSRGSEAMVQTPDGVVQFASQGDWFVLLPDQPLLVLNSVCFQALFKPA